MWNQHNLHHWAHKNQESAHYRFLVNVWAAIHGDNIIGPVFIDGALTGERFVNLLNDTVSEYTNNLNVHRYQRMWYQLDGAPAHSVATARQWLNNTFGAQWIGRFGPRRWPARSPDLTPLDFYSGFHQSRSVRGKRGFGGTITPSNNITRTRVPRVRVRCGRVIYLRC